MNKIDINNLSGKCLVAMPDTEGGFANSVIYICTHDDNGAMGFVINKRLKDLSFQDLSAELPFSFSNMQLSLYNGGPLEKNKGFIIHSAEYKQPESLVSDNGIAVSSSMEILKDIASGQGPKQKIIALGYASWAPQQLENEISNNQWLITNATPELIFGSDDDCKWAKALSSLGIRSDNLTLSFGHS